MPAKAKASAKKAKDPCAELKRKLKERDAQLNDRDAELKEAREQQTATADILSVISSSPTNLQPVFDAILEKATRLCDAHMGHLGLYDGERYQYVAQRGANAEYAKFLSERGPFRPLGPLGRMVTERQPVHLADTRDSSEYRDGIPGTVALVELGGARTFIGVPMLKEGRVVGAIQIYRPEVRPFTQKQIDLLSTFANQAVIAIENVRLFKELQARNAEVTESLQQQTATAEILKVISSSLTDTQPVFDAIVKSVAHLFGTVAAGLRLIKGNSTEFVANYPPLQEGAGAFPVPLEDESIASSRAIRRREVVQVPDVFAEEWVSARVKQLAEQRGFRALIVAPMLRENTVIGTINVTLATPGQFTDKQIALLKTFADQAVIAIENVRLFKELQARNAEITEALEQQTATAEILKVISSSPTDTQPVFEAIIDNALRLCDGQVGGLQLYDGENLRRAATRGRSPEMAKWLAENPITPGTPYGMRSRLIAEQQPIHVLDRRESRSYRERTPLTVALVELDGIRTSLTVPMLKEGRLVGAIGVNRREVRAFTQKQIDLISTFANQAVIAIENVRLFHEIEDKSQQLELASLHKSQFLANMSHELRTPLNAIIGVTEMLHEDAVDLKREDELEPLERVLRAARHLLALINDILDLSKIEAGKMDIHLESFALAPLIEDVVQTIGTMAAKNGNELVVHCAADLGSMHADQTRIRQALLNLASNANKFTERGTVTIDARRVTEAGREWVTMAVTDTGIGLTPGQMATLFQDFVQADASITHKYGGTGLGLAISRRFCQMMGGDITVASEPGRGSTFTIRLPAEVKDPAVDAVSA